MTDQLPEVTIPVEHRQAFLNHVADHPGCSVREACQQIGLKRKDIRALLRTDDDFADAYREARGYDNDTIRAEIRRRAIEGVDEPVFHNGEIVGHVRKYSDRLLDLMARMYLPEAKQRVELSGPEGGPVPVEVNGGRVTGITEVFELARAVGAGLRDGLSPGPAGGALPAAEDVLPAPPDGQ